MTEDWTTTDELKKEIITAVYQDINSQIEEMVEDLGCPRSFAESLLKSIADNFKDGTKAVKNESSYSSRHASTPEHEKGAEEIRELLVKGDTDYAGRVKWDLALKNPIYTQKAE